MTGRLSSSSMHAHHLHHRGDHVGVHASKASPTKTEPAPEKPVHITPQHRGVKLDTTGIPTEIRRDYLHDYYVIVSPNRGKRPFDTWTDEHHLVETANSPKLDQGKEVFSLQGEQGSWQVKVVENKFPALTPMNPEAYGMQEIVIDTPLSNRLFASLSQTQIKRVLQTFQERLGALKQQKAINYVSIFHNDGYSAGASLAHAHSQIFALPVVPPKIVAEASTIEQYFTQKGSDPFDDIIAFEQNAGSRIIWENERFIAFCPYASQWPFEAWILPKQPITSFTQFRPSEVGEVADILKKITGHLCSHQISYNFYLEEGVSPHHRFALKICGRSIIWGGLEVASGIIINTVPPESAAKWYKS